MGSRGRLPCLVGIPTAGLLLSPTGICVPAVSGTTASRSKQPPFRRDRFRRAAAASDRSARRPAQPCIRGRTGILKPARPSLSTRGSQGCMSTLADANRGSRASQTPRVGKHLDIRKQQSLAPDQTVALGYKQRSRRARETDACAWRCSSRWQWRGMSRGPSPKATVARAQTQEPAQDAGRLLRRSVGGWCPDRCCPAGWFGSRPVAG